MPDSTQPPDAPGPASAASNARANVMAVGAAVGLVLCMLMSVGLLFIIKTDSQASGLIIGLFVGVANTFGNALLLVYNFEFGSSRSSAAKDDRIGQMAGELMRHNANSVPITAVPQLQQPLSQTN